MTKAFNDIDTKALDALIQRVTDAKEHNLALSADDCQLLLDALVTLASVQERLANKDITIHKLRKLVGIVKSSEKLSGLLAEQASSADKPKKKRQNKSSKGDQPAWPKVKPEVIHHRMDELKKGDNCPECPTGKLYKYEPATLLRITGNSPFKPEQHVMERLRCNTCGAYFTAPQPPEVLADGASNQKYGYSARSLIGISKYYAGSPYYRQSSLQSILGVPMAASTIFDQTEHLSNALHPVFKRLVRHAGNAQHFYVDDTSHRILEQKPIVKKQRRSNKERLRTGVYTSGLIANTAENHRIILFETNIGHAGEFIDSVLRYRDQSQAPPIVMSDALSSNSVTVTITHWSLCNSHGRRQFCDVVSHFPEEVEHVLMRYKGIWHNEDKVREQKLCSAKRLVYHQTHSLPIMEEIKQWCCTHLQNETVEENSGLGKAMRYFVKHFEGLTCFCRLEGAQIDNNLMEAMLKLVVRDRKNAMFHKTLSGAAIGDVITSMIATAAQAGVNIFDYFNLLQRDHKKVIANPDRYLPWNYLENHKQLK